MENSYYKTQNLYEASYLLAKGFNLAGKEQAGNKISLLFKDTKEIREEALKFYNGKGEIEPKTFSDEYRSLKDFVFQKR